MRLVLLHAFPLDQRMWAGTGGEPLRLYGRGRTMDAWARSVLDELDGELILVGCSMGGYCALAAARLAPERVLGVVLAGARADPDTAERRAGRADTIELIRREGPEGLWESMRPKLLPEDADPGVVERARALALEQDPDELVAAVEAIRDREDTTDVLRALGDRSLALVGDRDPFVRPDEVPAGDVVVFEGCGHLVPLERPAETARLVGEAVERWT